MHRGIRTSFAGRLARITLTALLTAATSTAAFAAPATQKQYRLFRTGTPALICVPLGTCYKLRLIDAPVRQPDAGEVLVRVRAAALNRRDIFVKKGQYPMEPRDSLVPLSDGAGEVISVGRGVTRFRAGDRVAAIFYRTWLSGSSSPRVGQSALGGELDGMLSQYVTMSEDAFVKLPAGLSFEEGATLPCAAVTAWNGLIKHGHLRSGESVLLEGTGGVSIFGLQFAVAMGALPIITSSSDAKLKRARELGAVGTVNYRKTPDWGKVVRELTTGLGVDHVLEVGGEGTLPYALASLRPGGHIALIGGLAGFGAELPTLSLMDTNATVTGINVGSRADFEMMNTFIEQNEIKPVIDRVFELQQAPAAYDLMEAGNFFGKIVIRL